MRLLIVHGGSLGNGGAPYGLAETEDVVAEAVSVGEARASGEADGYDAIVVLPLTDNAAPQALCRQLRERGTRSPVIVLLSRSTASERVAVLEAGADDCVSDRIDPSELIARLAALTRR